MRFAKPPEHCIEDETKLRLLALKESFVALFVDISNMQAEECKLLLRHLQDKHPQEDFEILIVNEIISAVEQRLYEIEE